MRTIYCISGLGADQRIFSRLELPGVCLVHLEWFLPIIGESIEAYALRMKLKNSIFVDDPVLMGVSFGGMMAIEMARHFPAATVILISSAGTRRQLPAWMRVTGKLRLNRLLPTRPGKGIRVPGAGHFMVYNRSSAVDAILTRIVNSL